MNCDGRAVLKPFAGGHWECPLVPADALLLWTCPESLPTIRASKGTLPTVGSYSLYGKSNVWPHVHFRTLP